MKPTHAEGGRRSAAARAAPASTPAQTQALPAPANTIITAAAIDVAAVKRAVEMVRNRKQTDANEVKKNISDPAAKKLVEWVILRSDDSGADFARYVAFITANPTVAEHRHIAPQGRGRGLPGPAAQRASPGVFLAVSRRSPPRDASRSPARMLAAGNRKDAEGVVREAWRYDGFSQDVESRVVETFGEFLTNADHKARMDRRLYEKDDTEAGLRAAARLGGNEILIAKARISMLTKGGTKAALDAVPAAARNDIGYKFARIQMLRRADELAEAVALIKTIPQLDKSHDLDEWWMERRMLARKLLDDGNAKDAYAVVRDATPPDSGGYRSEHQFMAGWIALRYLHDPATAYAAFRQDRGDRRKPDLARARRLLGRPRRRSHAQGPGGEAALPGGRALSDRLLRPDRPRQGRPRRTGAQCLTRRCPAPIATRRCRPIW